MQKKFVTVAGMKVMRDFVRGLMSVIKIMGAPVLYRYPYRTSAEAMRSDWLKIGDDLECMMGRLKEGARHGKRRKR